MPSLCSVYCCNCKEKHTLYSLWKTYRESYDKPNNLNSTFTTTNPQQKHSKMFVLDFFSPRKLSLAATNSVITKVVFFSSSGWPVQKCKLHNYQNHVIDLKKNQKSFQHYFYFILLLVANGKRIKLSVWFFPLTFKTRDFTISFDLIQWVLSA